MKALDGRVLDRAVHPLDLTVGPAMVGPIDCARERLVAFDVWQTGDAMALQAAVQR